MRKFLQKTEDLINFLKIGKLIVNNAPFLHKYLIQKRFKKYAHKGDIVIQGGADFGVKGDCSNVLVYSRIVGPTGHVIAIEPDPNNVRELGDYIKRKNIKNVTLINKAIWNKNERMNFEIGEKTWHNALSSVLDKETNKKFTSTIEVEADTVDSILKSIEKPEKSISHICLTINGAEYEGLQGMKEVLSGNNKLSLLIVNQSEARRDVNGTPFVNAIEEELSKYSLNVSVGKRWILGQR